MGSQLYEVPCPGDNAGAQPPVVSLVLQRLSLMNSIIQHEHLPGTQLAESHQGMAAA